MDSNQHPTTNSIIEESEANATRSQQQNAQESAANNK
jgi:hypothetical protein